MASIRKYIELISIAAVTGVGPAMAADMARPMAPAPILVPMHNWTGLYAGVNIGGAWSNIHVTDVVNGVNTKFNNADFIGGGQVGYNYQFSSGWLMGVEFDFDWGGGDRSSRTFNGVQASIDGPSWLTTLAGRFGYAWDRWLVYGKAGGGWLETSASFRNLATGASASTDHVSTLWMLGLGTEYAWSPNWSTKLEYNYLGSGNWSASDVVVAGGRATIGGDIQLIKAGFNYKF
jgi:outer membrane immunogenic protein